MSSSDIARIPNDPLDQGFQQSTQPVAIEIPKDSVDQNQTLADLKQLEDDRLPIASLDLNVAPWQFEEPFGVRSLPPSTSTVRLTTIRNSPAQAIGSSLPHPASASAHDESSSSSAQATSVEPLPATSTSNRQQLMQQYLKETDMEVY